MTKESRWLVASVAFVWIATGIAVLHPYYREVGGGELRKLGLPAWIMYATCAFEVVLGARVAFGAPTTFVTGVQAALVAGFTAVLAISEPLYLAHPFGVLTKNLPLLAALGTAWLVEREGWTPRAQHLLRAGVAAIWITEGLFPKILFQQEQELQLVRAFLPASIDPALFLGFMGAAELASGVAVLTLRGHALAALLGCQALALIALPILVALPDPRVFVHPFGPLTKNVPIFAGTLVLAARALRDRPFLEARWRDLAIFTFAVEPARLEPLLPKGVELDVRDGRAFLSLVALDMEEARVLGIRWPFHHRFADINLRFYVHRGADRGVVFIRELVPLRAVAWIARAVYGEPFRAVPIESRAPKPNVIERRFHLGRAHVIRVETANVERVPAIDSDEHFFKERGFGFSKTRAAFEVKHPVWAVRDVTSFELDVDWAEVYGPEWAFLAEQKPSSVTFAVGSDVAVF